MTDSNTPSPDSSETKVSFSDSFRKSSSGKERNPFDPRVFHNITLIAFFAWVGMGADGISSANYGPEEAYRAIGSNLLLGSLLALAIAAIIVIISASYVHIIEQFPSGGGGYVVASKLLHPRFGVISGAALVIDYILTISVSVVAGVDAIFSLLPQHWVSLRVEVSVVVVVGLIVLNLRGIRESVMILTPIFLVFIISHFGLVLFGLYSHLHVISERVPQAVRQAHEMYRNVGLLAIIGVFLHAFSMGAGTFTGIEAVSNGLLSLREPRVRTGKRTMIYMALSLASLAALLLINYFLFDIHPVEGKTLNAVLFDTILKGSNPDSLSLGAILLWATLIAAALLLIVAAQTGFIDGPRVLANMALDSWLPHRLSHLSERLVARNGILIMGVAAILTILYAHGNTNTLVSLYAINVFITFSLSQLGMTRLWLQKRKLGARWAHNFAVNGIGFVTCATLLVIMVTLKFSSGGWLTLVVTAGLVILCFFIQRHYLEVHAKVEKLDEILTNLPFGEQSVAPQELDPKEPTAVILVEKYGGTGVHVLLNVQRLFGFRFKQYIFLAVGPIDSGHFKGIDELNNLKREAQQEAEKYVTLARSYGLKAVARSGCAIDYITEIENICVRISEEYPNTVFFTARLLFWKDTLWSRILHNETPIALQRRLMFRGLQVVVLPVRLR